MVRAYLQSAMHECTIRRTPATLECGEWARAGPQKSLMTARGLDMKLESSSDMDAALHSDEQASIDGGAHAGNFEASREVTIDGDASREASLDGDNHADDIEGSRGASIDGDNHAPRHSHVDTCATTDIATSDDATDDGA